MAGYMTYWPQEQLRKLKKAGDYGPIKVIFGSIHTKMPSISKVKIGDIIYPVTLSGGHLLLWSGCQSSEWRADLTTCYGKPGITMLP